MNDIADFSGFLRLHQIIGRKAITPEQAARNRADKKRGRRVQPEHPALIKVSATTWWSGIRQGRYPAPVRIGERCVAWRAQDIAQLLSTLSATEVVK